MCNLLLESLSWAISVHCGRGGFETRPYDAGLVVGCALRTMPLNRNSRGRLFPICPWLIRLVEPQGPGRRLVETGAEGGNLGLIIPAQVDPVRQ